MHLQLCLEHLNKNHLNILNNKNFFIVLICFLFYLFKIMLSILKTFFLITTLFGVSFFISYLITKYFFKKLRNNKKKIKVLKFTIGIFLFIFAAPKLINIPQFVEIFSKYDLITSVFKPYGYIYPFIEISIAFLIIFETNSNKLKKIYYALIIIMILNLMSVSKQLVSGKSLQCGCLNSFVKLPLSFVSLLESIMMIGMTFYLLHLNGGKKRVRFNPSPSIKYFFKTDLVK